MQIRAFPPHYQLVYINFDISSFSLISYPTTSPKLPQYKVGITPVLRRNTPSAPLKCAAKKLETVCLKQY